MPLYTFQCASHGRFDLARAMRESDSAGPCPVCSAPSKRVVTAPHLNLGDARARRLIDATKQTADQPPVVTSIPGRPRRVQKVARDPRLRKLPGPQAG